MARCVERVDKGTRAWDSLASSEAARQPCQGTRKEKGPALSQSTRSQVHTCLDGVMDLGACVAGSLPGDGHRIGNSFRGWRMDEERKGSAMAGVVRMGCRHVEGTQTPRASTDGLGLQEAVGTDRDSLGGWE